MNRINLFLIIVGYLFGIGGFLLWEIAIIFAFLKGTWQVTIGFNMFGEGMLEMFLIPMVIIMQLIGFYLMIDKIKYKKEDNITVEKNR